MLARSDKEIEDAYEFLQEISSDDKKRMEYEAREAWLMDQRTREESAHEEGMEKGIEKGRLEERMGLARNALNKGVDISLIEELTEIPIKELEKMSREIKNP